MRILSFHPFSIYTNGGGSRILRRLYQGQEKNVTCLVVLASRKEKKDNAIKEVVVYKTPTDKKWLRSFLRTFNTWLGNSLFKFITVSKIQKQAAKIDFDVLHVINHAAYSDSLSRGNLFADKPLWATFHDHFSSVGSSFEVAQLLWNKADRRLVISEELGNEYIRLFGTKSYEIITDGLYENEIVTTLYKPRSAPVIYFAGLLLIDYYPLFAVLADALDELANNNVATTLILRGTQKLSFLSNRKFKVEYQPFTLDAKELKEELNSADILYLPMKFTNADFYRFSLSTKMIGYLGSQGSILYHGPADSAANKLLSKHEAAVSCTSLHRDELLQAITDITNQGERISVNAKKLATKQFLMPEILQKFWIDEKKSLQ